MIKPTDQLDDRLDSLYQSVEAGEAVDVAKLNALLDLDAVAATSYFARQAIEISNEADAASDELQRQADNALLGDL